MTSSKPIAPLLHAYFVEHLLNHKRVSPQTVSAYRDTFRLLLNWLRDSARKEPASLDLADIDAPVVLSFLNALEEQRGNSVRSRNARLAAIRSFFRFVALRQPESLEIANSSLGYSSQTRGPKTRRLSYTDRD